MSKKKKAEWSFTGTNFGGSRTPTTGRAEIRGSVPVTRSGRTRIEGSASTEYGEGRKPRYRAGVRLTTRF